MLQDSVACAETVANDLSDYYAEKSTQPEVEQFCEVHNQIATCLYQTFVSHLSLPDLCKSLVSSRPL